LKNVLVSGGAGYVGSVLVRLLLQRNYRVRVIDNFMFGGESLIEVLGHPDFDYQIGDLRDDGDLKKALEGMDHVVHLAAIVGDPACAKEPELATAVNYDGSIQFYNLSAENKINKFVFASTCSNYGKMDDPESYVNEESELSPVSLYAELKVKVEEFLLAQSPAESCKPTCLRFSTVYGISPRLRFDLTVNEFTKELAMKRELLIYGEQFWRSYCHVADVARSVISVLEDETGVSDFNVFNVGDTGENYRKQMIVAEILAQIPDGRVKYVKKDEDPRDYRVNSDKIKKDLHFEITKTVPDGIREIRRMIQEGFVVNPDDAKYRNI
jgi:nucleoside-diphosphate-sugar epimerase